MLLYDIFGCYVDNYSSLPSEFKWTLCQCGLLYRVIRNDCRGFNNLSYTIRL